MKSRTENSIRNLKYAMIGQTLGIIISLFSRMIFVKFLSSEYLGLSGLFTNILTILSLTELGFVTAMSYQLYKPLVENDIESLKSLMKFYKKVYLIIALSILVLGLLTLPFYKYLINEIPNIPYLDLIYYLFVLNTAASYLFSYKRLLIISDQKRYIATLYRYTFYFVLNVAQIFILYLTKNYILYLIIQLLMTLLENILLDRKANKLYPYLKDKNVKPLKRNVYKQIISNVKAMFFHKFGGVVLNSTDNIVISKVIGLSVVGLYSNYMLIINALKTIVTQIFSSVIASIGNLQVTGSKSKMTDIFKKTFFADFCIHTFSAICLICLLNPFISLWLGNEYILDIFTVYMIALNYYLFGMRKTCMSFREATGNYESDKYSPIIEAVINIGTSVVLAKFIGLPGVILGTIISCLCTNFWWEPLVITRKSLTMNLKDYFSMYFKYTITGIILCVVTVFANSLIPCGGFMLFGIRLLVTVLIPVVSLCFIYRKNEYFLYYKMVIKNKITFLNK